MPRSLIAPRSEFRVAYRRAESSGLGLEFPRIEIQRSRARVGRRRRHRLAWLFHGIQSAYGLRSGERRRSRTIFAARKPRGGASSPTIEAPVCPITPSASVHSARIKRKSRLPFIALVRRSVRPRRSGTRRDCFWSLEWNDIRRVRSSYRPTDFTARKETIGGCVEKKSPDCRTVEDDKPITEKPSKTEQPAVDRVAQLNAHSPLL